MLTLYQVKQTLLLCLNFVYELNFPVLHMRKQRKANLVVQLQKTFVIYRATNPESYIMGNLEDTSFSSKNPDH
jgi:hypothetical protein